MYVMYDVLNETKGVSYILQSRDASLTEALITELRSFRYDVKSNEYFEEALYLATENDLKCAAQEVLWSRKSPSNLNNDFVIERMIEKHEVKLNNVKEFDTFIRHFSLAFTELCKILKISLTFAVVMGECERTFSKLKLIKTHIRTTMLDKRLTHLFCSFAGEEFLNLTLTMQELFCYCIQ